MLRRLQAFALLCLAVAGAPAAQAVVLHAGDILTLDPVATPGVDQTEIIRIHPVTGAQTPIGPAGVEYVGFNDMAVGADGFVYVASRDFVVAYDPVTGGTTEVVNCFGDLGGACTGLGVDAAGVVHVSSVGPTFSNGVADGVVSRPPAPLASADLLTDPYDVAVRSDGDVLASNVSPNRIVRIDGVTGAQSLVAAVPAAARLVVDAGGDAILRASGLLHVDVDTGTVTTILPGLPAGFALAIEDDGNLLATRTVPERVIRVEPSTGVESPVASGGLIETVLALAVVPGCTSCPACSNYLDDDGDGLVDFGEDPHCANAADTSEATPPPPPGCGLGPELLPLLLLLRRARRRNVTDHCH